MARQRTANARNDEPQNDGDTEGSATTGARKRKRSVSSEPRVNNVAVNRNTPLRLHVQSLIDVVRPHLLRLLEDTDNVNLWISLLHPHIDHGNNVGLDVQSSAQGVVIKAAVR